MIALALVAFFATLSPAGTLIAAEDDLSLADARAVFEEQRKAAVDASQRRAELQEWLDDFDARVDAAKKEIERTSRQDAVLADRLAFQRTLMTSLADQQGRVAEAKGALSVLALRQREDLRRYARLMAARDVVMTDAGPVFGGDVLRQLLRPSLGERIDASLERRAVLAARQALIDRLKTALYDVRHAQDRLHAAAIDMDRQTAEIIARRETLGATLREQQQFVETSWKEKVLTEQELKAAATEASESSARLAAAQESLRSVSDTLKAATLNSFRAQASALSERRTALDQRREELLRSDVAMKLLQEAARDARESSIAQRNSDRKLYRRIEEVEGRERHVTETLAHGTIALDDGSGASGPMTDADRETLLVQQADLRAMLVLMRQGIPEEQAAQQVQAERVAAYASVERQRLAGLLSALTSESSDLDAQEKALRTKEREAERRYALDDLAPVFAWPVVGRITAGFLDPDYEKVFHFVHRAIDIAVPQGSSVRAIADGVVLAVRDGGATGYSYVLLGHRAGYASLYGHVSKFLVTQGDVVATGQAIALSGGQPGTPGAGKSTTGPHVHLEITKDGMHIDPRTVLR